MKSPQIPGMRCNFSHISKRNENNKITHIVSKQTGSNPKHV